MPLGGSSYSTLDEGNYVLRLARLEDAEPGQYGARIKWVFNAWKLETGEAVTDEQSGELYEWWQTTSESTGPKSTARPWIEAFLGRKLPDKYTVQEMNAWCQEMIGKTAEAYVAPNQNDYTTILRIRPRQARAAAAPEPVAVAPAAPPASTAAPSLDDLPFHHDPSFDGISVDDPFGLS